MQGRKNTFQPMAKQLSGKAPSNWLDQTDFDKSVSMMT
jgi:hypothetical protein